MNLPGRLRATTLGDLLGSLHRAAATGTLELADDRGRSHRVYLAKGLVAAVDLDEPTPSLAEILRREQAADEDVLRRSLLRAIASRRLHGEVLVDDFCLSPSVVGRALRQQVLSRLAVLERLTDARVSFRVALRVPRGALAGDAGGAPLEPREFLHGRRRARPRESGSHRRAETATGTTAPGDDGAWQILGVPPGTDPAEIKRAYKRLARSVHPDLHPQATDDERRSLQARFAEITEAYRSLVA